MQRLSVNCLVAITFSIALAYLWFIGFNQYIDWGGDWAGYVLQAKSLATHSMLIELKTNTLVMEQSDVQLGPIAYPWGYPAILAIFGMFSEWDILWMKTIGGGSLLALSISTYYLSRHFLSELGSILISVFVALQPSVLMSSQSLSTDAPFLALATLTLTLTLSQFRNIQIGGRTINRTMILCALLAALAFSIRSNGAVLHCTYIGSILVAAYWGRIEWKPAVTHVLSFGSISVLLVSAYFLAFPDGSLSHARYITADPQTLVNGILSHIRTINDFLPFSLLSGYLKLILVVPVFSLVVIAIVCNLRTVSVLLIYMVGHFALLTVFPFDGGPRYYFPVIAPIFILVTLGATVVSNWCGGSRHVNWNLKTRSTFGAGITVLCIVLFAYSSNSEIQGANNANQLKGPYSKSAKSMVEYVIENVPLDASIAFRKPRVLRFLSGHAALAITDANRLTEMDFFIFDHEHTNGQVLNTSIGANQFDLAYENAGFAVYVNRDRQKFQ